MARGLSDTDIDGLRRQLEAGKRPRVQLSGPHFPVGATGTVVRVGQPDIDGADYLRVRVKVDNMTDELAFSPAELKLPGRPARKAAARSQPAATRPAPPAAASFPPGPPLIESTAARPAKAAASKAATSKAATSKAPAGTTAAKAPAVRTDPAQPTPAESRSAASGSARSRAAKRGPATSGSTKAGRRRVGPMQKVTFTVASSGAAWALSATRGSKNVVKNVPLAPGVVDALAELLDQPALTEAIGEINDAALAEAQARAEELRAELSQLEAVLATHHRP